MWPLQPLNSSVNSHQCINILLVIFPSGDMNKVHKHNSFFFVIYQTNGYSWQVAIFKLSVVTWKNNVKEKSIVYLFIPELCMSLGWETWRVWREENASSILILLCPFFALKPLCRSARSYHPRDSSSLFLLPASSPGQGYPTPSSWVGYYSIWNREREKLVEGFHAIFFFNFSD